MHNVHRTFVVQSYNTDTKMHQVLPYALKNKVDVEIDKTVGRENNRTRRNQRMGSSSCANTEER